MRDLSEYTTDQKKNIYDIVSAIRGFDDTSLEDSRITTQLKYDLTGRIRGIVFCPNEVPCGAIYVDKPMTNYEKEQIIITVGEMTIKDKARYRHWFMHLYLAIEITKQHPIWGSVEIAKDILAVLIRNTKY